ncbi:DNA repair protein RecO [Candidatus Parcubacteria bacterium]|nr:MAG: DNA repair protein RecO [Candidatus Parcubacteria bacterium]
MEETYFTKAIILDRETFREFDVKVLVFSEEKGRLSLVARGAKKPKSKLAGHIEPLNMLKMMVVKGKNYQYLTSAVSLDSFVNIKEDLDKLGESGRAVRLFKKIIREHEIDKNLYNLLKEFLEFVNKIDDVELEFYKFALKLATFLGYEPYLNKCLDCAKEELRFYFSAEAGGIICEKCLKNHKQVFAISENDIKGIKNIIKSDFKNITNISKNISDKNFKRIVEELFLYNFDIKI